MYIYIYIYSIFTYYIVYFKLYIYIYISKYYKYILCILNIIYYILHMCQKIHTHTHIYIYKYIYIYIIRITFLEREIPDFCSFFMLLQEKTMLKTISLHSAPTQITLYTCGCWKMATFDDAIIAPRSAQRMKTLLSTEARNC